MFSSSSSSLEFGERGGGAGACNKSRKSSLVLEAGGRAPFEDLVGGRVGGRAFRLKGAGVPLSPVPGLCCQDSYLRVCARVRACTGEGAF